MLLAARSLEEAQDKAAQHARGQETAYANSSGEAITWRVERIEDVTPLLYDTFSDGTQLYARHFRNYEAYRRFRDEEL